MERLLARGLKIAHLRLAATLLEEQKLVDAALRLGIAQPAASRLAAELTEILGTPLFEREGRGVRLTEAGRAFARRASRILGEIDDAGREVTELSTGARGLVRIGSVTGPAVELALPAIRKARVIHPAVQVAIEVSTSDQLCQMVRGGQLDFALARLPEDASAEQFDYYPLGTEPVCLMVRDGHALTQLDGPVPRAALSRFDWILPPQGAILSRTIETVLRENDIALPDRVLNTSSFLLTLVMVTQTNAIAAIAVSVGGVFERNGTIRRVPIDFDIAVGQYGIITRAGGMLPPAATLIRDMVLEESARQPT